MSPAILLVVAAVMQSPDTLRLEVGAGFSASPVVSDGRRLYLIGYYEVIGLAPKD